MLVFACVIVYAVNLHVDVLYILVYIYIYLYKCIYTYFGTVVLCFLRVMLLLHFMLTVNDDVVRREDDNGSPNWCAR